MHNFLPNTFLCRNHQLMGRHLHSAHQQCSQPPSCTRWPRGPSKRHCCKCGPTTDSGDPSWAATQLICFLYVQEMWPSARKQPKPSAHRTTWCIHPNCLTPPSCYPWRGSNGTWVGLMESCHQRHLMPHSHGLILKGHTFLYVCGCLHACPHWEQR